MFANFAEFTKKRGACINIWICPIRQISCFQDCYIDFVQNVSHQDTDRVLPFVFSVQYYTVIHVRKQSSQTIEKTKKVVQSEKNVQAVALFVDESQDYNCTKVCLNHVLICS